VPVEGAHVSVLVLVDGTLVLGYESTGADVFSADNAQLNRNAAAHRRALNVLPAGAYIQNVWHTGGSFEDMISAYERRGAVPRHSSGHASDQHKIPLLVEQRRSRARMLRADATLRRGRLVVFIGQKGALGPLSSHTQNRGGPFGAFFGGLGALFGAARHPQSIEPVLFTSAVERLFEVAARVRDELSSTGAVLTPLSGQALLSEVHKALNPITSKVVPALLAGSVTDHAQELPSALLGDPAYAIHWPVSLREQLPLGDLVWSEEHFTLDDPPALSRALSLQRLPAFTKPDLMMGLQFATGGSVRLVSTFVATDREALTERLIRKRNIAHAQAVGIVRDIAADVAFSEYERVLEKMLTEDQRVFHASVTAVVHADSHDALDRATRELKDAFLNAGALLTTETGRQLGAFLGSLPGNGFLAPRQHQLITNNAADLLAYFNPSEGDFNARARDPSVQLLFHTRQATLRAVSLQPSNKRANENGLVFGGSGTGKSFNMACNLEQACLFEGAPLLVVDVQGPALSSYKVLAEVFGGSYTALASDSDAAFSPFVPHAELFLSHGVGGEARTGAFTAQVDEEALRFMTALVALMGLPELEARREKPFALEIARTAILSAYAATRRCETNGAKEDGAKEDGPRAERAPLLCDVTLALGRLEHEHEEHRVVAREMYLQLLAWLNDPVRARLINRPARTAGLGASGKQMQVFDFFGMEKDQELATVLLLSVSFSIWQQLRSHARDVRKFVVFDECWKLLTNQTASDLVAELFRTGRKWGASTWAITQNLADFESSPIHKAVLNNVSMIFLMQHAGDHAAVSDVCGLNEREQALFRQLKMKKGEFSEMLFVERGAVSSSSCSGGGGAVGHASILRLVPTPCDLWLNTTDPTDVGFRDRIIRDKGLTLHEAIRFCAEHYPKGAPRALHGPGGERRSRGRPCCAHANRKRSAT
jgi:hypothetical protein